MIKAISTKGMSREDWLSCRRLGLGGSDVGAVCGLSHYRSPVDVYLDKTQGRVDSEMSEPAYWGTLLEDVVAKEFSRRTGLSVRRINFLLQDDWRIANIDRVVVENGKAPWVRGQLRTGTLLECKTASAHMADAWGPTQETEILAGFVTSEHKIPDTYETQIQWYMGITGAKRCFVAVLIGGNDFRIYLVEFDRALYERLVDVCSKFWHEHVLTKVEPKATTADDVIKLHPTQASDEMAEADDILATDIGELRNIKGRIAELTKEADAIKDRLCIAIGDKSGLTIAGETACTWKGQETTRINSAALKRERPDIYTEYSNTTTSRVFRIK